MYSSRRSRQTPRTIMSDHRSRAALARSLGARRLNAHRRQENMTPTLRWPGGIHRRFCASRRTRESRRARLATRLGGAQHRDPERTRGPEPQFGTLGVECLSPRGCLATHLRQPLQGSPSVPRDALRWPRVEWRRRLPLSFWRSRSVPGPSRLGGQSPGWNCECAGF